jgi:hypothetical protein
MKASRVRFAFHLLVAIVAVVTAGSVRAWVIGPEFLTPIDRMLVNASRDLKNSPDSASAHYSVARLHYLVFSTGLTVFPERVGGERVRTIDVERARQLRAEELAREDIGDLHTRIPADKKRSFDTALVRRRRQLDQSGWTPATSLPPSSMARHASEAMRELEAALRLEPTNAHYALFRASLAEQFLEWSQVVKSRKPPPNLADLDEAKIMELYLEAFHIGFEADSKQGKIVGELTQTVTFEAGQAYLRLHDKVGSNKADRSDWDDVAAKLQTMKTWPREELIQLISPIVFSLEGESDLTRLLDTEARVDFDLRGFGPRQRWSWVRPNLGLLVWDPQRTGVIASGRQLFGNYTFQIVWETGYAALAALDDDGDGVLRGKELEGLRVWFDRNSDGISTPDEVVDLADCGIVGLVVKADGMAGIHPTNSRGLHMADGRTLPTWDWMAEPITR